MININKHQTIGVNMNYKKLIDKLDNALDEVTEHYDVLSSFKKQFKKRKKAIVKMLKGNISKREKKDLKKELTLVKEGFRILSTA